MRRHILAFVSGALFTLGLSVASMTEPGKVRAFLDVTGDWDPSLALVMVGAIGVYALLHALSARLEEPWHALEFALPNKRNIDARLITGAALFGVGWGLAGLCPGPAWSVLGTGNASILAFVVSMLTGMLLVRAADGYTASAAARVPATAGATRDG